MEEKYRCQGEFAREILTVQYARTLRVSHRDVVRRAGMRARTKLILEYVTSGRFASSIAERGSRLEKSGAHFVRVIFIGRIFRPAVCFAFRFSRERFFQRHRASHTHTHARLVIFLSALDGALCERAFFHGREKKTKL